MGNSNSINKVNFENVQDAINNNNINTADSSLLIINTLDEHNQGCLIQNTISPQNEVEILNSIIKKRNAKAINIIIYGANSNDDRLYKKYTQLVKLGFSNTFLYIGGLFEWMLLQEIYGSEEFPTTTVEIDILKFNPSKNIIQRLY